MERVYSTTLMATVMAFAVSGCATIGEGVVDSPAAVAAPAANQDYEVIMSRARQATDKAEKEFLKFYSPSHYRATQNYFSLAEKTYSRLTNKDTSFFDNLNPFSANSREELERYAELAKSEVEAGVRAKVLVKQLLDPSLQQVRMLDKVNAKSYFEESYKEHLQDLSELIIAVEQGETEQIKTQQSELISRMYETEIKTVKFVTLNKTKEALQTLADDEGEKRTPELLQRAMLEIRNAEQFIEKSPRQEQGVAAVGKRAADAVEHLKYVLVRVKSMDEQTPEQIVLGFEKLLAPALKTANKSDYFYKDVAEQAGLIQSALQTQQQEFAALNARLQNTEQRLEETSAELATRPAVPEPEPVMEQDPTHASAAELEISIEDMNDLFDQFDSAQPKDK